MRPGETDPKKKRIYFPLFDADGLPASGKANEGAIWAPLAGELQYIRDEDVGGYVNATLANFAHISGGQYRYEWDNAEISGVTEGVIQLRCKDDATAALGGIREQNIAVPLEFIAVHTIDTDAVDANALKADAVTEIQSGLATAANLAIVAAYLDTEIAQIIADIAALGGGGGSAEVNAVSGPFRVAPDAELTIVVWVPTATLLSADFVVQIRKPGAAAAVLYTDADLGAGVDWVAENSGGCWLQIEIPATETDVAGYAAISVILDEIPQVVGYAVIEIGDTGWSTVIEGGFDAAWAMRILLSRDAGGAQMPPTGVGSYEFLSLDGSKPRVSGTVDALGERVITAVDGTE